MSNGFLDKMGEFFLGQVDKAIILVHEKGDPSLEKKDAVQPKSKGAYGTGIADMSSNNITEASRIANTQGIDSKLKGQATQLVEGLAGKTTGLRTNIPYNKEFEVQFNPSSLRISSQRYEEEDVTKVNGTGGVADISKGANYPYMELHVTLVFERVVHNEAFIRDSAFSNASTAMYSLYNSVIKESLEKQSGYFDNRSVQSMVEGFTAAIRKENTREIAFCWSTMIYEGVLKNVRTTYTMFDLHGRPIRGEVALTILLSDTEINSTDMGYWTEAYDNAFGFKEGGAFSKVKSAMDAAGSFVDKVSNTAVSAIGTLQGLSGLLLTVGGAIAGAVNDEKGPSDSEKLAKQIQKKQEQRTKRQERDFESGRANDSGISLSDTKREEYEKKREEERDKKQKAVKETKEQINNLESTYQKKLEDAKKAAENGNTAEAQKLSKEAEETAKEIEKLKKSLPAGTESEEVERQKTENSSSSESDSSDDSSESKEEQDDRTPAQKEYEEAAEAYNDALDEENDAEDNVTAAQTKYDKEKEKVDDLITAESKAQTEYEAASEDEDTARKARDTAEAELDEALTQL